MNIQSTSTNISEEQLTALINERCLDSRAANELLKWADEHLNDLVKTTSALERKMHIMLVTDLAVLYLLFQIDPLPDSSSAFSPFWQETTASLWSGLLISAWGCVIFAVSFLVAGFFATSRTGLRGTNPANWNIEYLTLPPNAETNESKNHDYILGHLCIKYSKKMQISQTTHDRKLRLYKLGFVAHCILLFILVLGAILRILAVALP